MLKRLYTTAVMTILQFFNYNKIEDKTGTNHGILNFIDLILAAAYLAFSLWKLKEVTNIVFWMNMLTLSRLMVSNVKASINIREKYHELYLKKPGLLLKSAFDIKLGIEFLIITFTFLPSFVQGIVFKEEVIRSFAGTVIWMGFIENLISIFAALFQASMEIDELKTYD